MSKRGTTRPDAPIVQPHAGLQPEMYISLESYAAAVEIWSECTQPGLPEVRCTTCGRIKRVGDVTEDFCGSSCPGFNDRPWPEALGESGPTTR